MKFQAQPEPEMVKHVLFALRDLDSAPLHSSRRNSDKALTFLWSVSVEKEVRSTHTKKAIPVFLETMFSYHAHHKWLIARKSGE